MEISLEWLKDYVALPADVETTAAKLTAAGLEVEGLRSPGAGLDGVLVAQVKEAVPHPNAEKLQVTQVDIGGSALLQIVCGAKNFKVGDKVPLATTGSELPGGLKIGRAALRGVDSFGMLCSSKELGFGEGEDGLLILDPALEVGTPITKALGLDDTLLSLNVTPNRPDALNHLGVAREVSVVTGQPLKLPPHAPTELGAPAAEVLSVTIEDAERCARYAARVIEGVTVGSSPAWLKRRLEAVGVRSINNVVDVTNYVLMELGHPLHAFDLNKLEGGKLIVRTARPGETIKTLDGKDRTLDPSDLVIADASRAQAIAGVMGGADSEVDASTTRVVLESAWFLPASIRKSARRHGLHSEASHRFERGADVGVVPFALDRAAKLIAELSGGTVRPGQVEHVARQVPAREVSLRHGRIEQVLGVDVVWPEALRILTALGFDVVREAEDVTRFRVPTARVDVEREEDLIEEIARIHGYEKIPALLPRGSGSLSPEPKSMEAERRLRQALAGHGLDEVVNYAFVSERALSSVGEAGPFITLLNPLSAEQSVMRTSLFPSLLENLARSLRHQVEALRLYEIGRTYHRDPEGGQGRRPAAREVAEVGGLLHGLRNGRTWTSKDERIDFYDAKGAVEAALAALHVEDVRWEPRRDDPSLHPGAAASIVAADGTVLGRVGQLHPRVARALDLPEDVFLFSLELVPLLERSQLVPQAKGLPRFPAVLRDLAVVVPDAQSVEAVRALIREVGQPLVEDAQVFDVYTGANIPEGHRSLAFAIRYRAPERTLQDAEVSEAHQRIVAEVHERLGASLRA